MWDNLKFNVHKLIGFWKVNLLQGTCLLCQYLMYFGIHLWYSLSYSRNKASSTLRMRKIEKFEKRTFFSKVCPSVHTDPSRKRIFFENALQTGENWKLQYCVLVWTKHFWKTCDFRARVLTGDCCEFKFLQRTAVWTVTKAMVLQNGFVLRLYLWYLLCKNLPSTHSVTTPTKAIQDWLIFLRNRSNTKDRIWPHFQTPRRELKIPSIEEYFWQTSRWKCGKTLPLVWYISIETKLRRKRRIVKKKWSQISCLTYFCTVVHVLRVLQ